MMPAHRSGQNSSSAGRFTKLSLEQLERRDIPSVGATLIASAIVNSVESYSDIIKADFQTFLHRAPDVLGFNALLTQMENGAAQETIEAEFVSSPEYVLNHGGVSPTWINGLYHDLLGRSPSAAEQTFWTDEIALGLTTNQIALSFTTSVERDTIFVRNEYQTLLGRAADTTGLSFFVTAMREGTTRSTVESVILGSTEFITHHGSSNTSFVDAVYTNVLHRSPSSAELTFWVDELIVL